MRLSTLETFSWSLPCEVVWAVDAHLTTPFGCDFVSPICVGSWQRKLEILGFSLVLVCILILESKLWFVTQVSYKRVYLVVESLRFEKTAKIANPNPSHRAHHVPQCHFSMVLGHLWGWWPHHLPGQLCQCSTTLSKRKISLTSSLSWHNLRPFPLIQYRWAELSLDLLLLLSLLAHCL